MSIHCGQMLTFRHEYSDFIENYRQEAKNIILQFGESSVQSKSYTTAQYSQQKVTQLRTILLICGTWGDAPLINAGIADGQLSRMDLVSPQINWDNPSDMLVDAFKNDNDIFDKTVWKYGEISGAQLLLSILEYDVDLQNTDALDVDKYLSGYKTKMIATNNEKYDIYNKKVVRMWNAEDGIFEQIVDEDESDVECEENNKNIVDESETMENDSDEKKEVESNVDWKAVEYYKYCRQEYTNKYEWVKKNGLLREYNIGNGLKKYMPFRMRRKQLKFVFKPWKSFGEDVEPTNEENMNDLKKRYPWWKVLSDETGAEVALIVPEKDCHPVVLLTFLHYLEIGKMPKYIPSFLPWKRLSYAVKFNKSVFMRCVQIKLCKKYISLMIIFFCVL